MLALAVLVILCGFIYVRLAHSGLEGGIRYRETFGKSLRLNEPSSQFKLHKESFSTKNRWYLLKAESCQHFPCKFKNFLWLLVASQMESEVFFWILSNVFSSFPSSSLCFLTHTHTHSMAHQQALICLPFTPLSLPFLFIFP